jgi:hypothetical protein
MEAERAAADPTTLAEWDADPGRQITGMSHSCAFNMDKTRCSDFSEKGDHGQGRETINLPGIHRGRWISRAFVAHPGGGEAETELSCNPYNAANVTIVIQANAFMTWRLFEV